jgi:kinesin family protein 2/24
MMGLTDGSIPGLYLLASYDIIGLLKSYPELQLYVSFYEIYCGKLYDLLN